MCCWPNGVGVWVQTHGVSCRSLHSLFDLHACVCHCCRSRTQGPEEPPQPAVEGCSRGDRAGTGQCSGHMTCSCTALDSSPPQRLQWHVSRQQGQQQCHRHENAAKTQCQHIVCEFQPLPRLSADITKNEAMCWTSTSTLNFKPHLFVWGCPCTRH